MKDFSRRDLIGVIAATGAGFALSRESSAQTTPIAPPRFGYAEVIARARDLAHGQFEDTPAKLPEPFLGLDYDSWREIRFKRDHDIFVGGNGGFRLETFHLGFLYQRPVTINTIREGVATPIPYSAALFDYGRLKVDKPLPINTGFAGFRLHFPINDLHVHDEVISFLGASYFRLLGRGQKYGLSARALSVDAGMPGESFPFFREFWIETPAPTSNAVTIYALLDSAAATGAYRFDLAVGPESAMEVKATLFARRANAKFGLAPLTSMYLTGENDRAAIDGFRTELHDSDGLLMHTGAGEWLWRPLVNPPSERISTFIDANVRGYGLLQRDRKFDSYQDLDLNYEDRPSYFVEPLGDWGPGRVELVELPTVDETYDNLVVSWVGEKTPEPDKPFEYGYRITSGLDMPRLTPNGYVVNTFEANAHALGSKEPHSAAQRRFMVDFAGGDLAYYVNDPSQVEAVATASNGKVLRANVMANPHIEGLRVLFDVAVPPGQTSDQRLFLRASGRALTETWTCPWTAPAN